MAEAGNAPDLSAFATLDVDVTTLLTRAEPAHAVAVRQHPPDAYYDAAGHLAAQIAEPAPPDPHTAVTAGPAQPAAPAPDQASRNAPEQPAADMPGGPPAIGRSVTSERVRHG